MQFDDLLLQLLSSEAQEEEPLDRVLLLQLVDLAEHCPPANDVQPLKYVLAWQPAQVEMVSRHLRHGTAMEFAPDLNLRPGPAGFILILGDTRISFRYDWDCRVAAQAILLGAAVGGLDGRVLYSMDRSGLRASLSIPDHLEILAVVALGQPRHTLLRPDGTPDARPDWYSAVPVGRGQSRSELVMEVAGF